MIRLALIFLIGLIIRTAITIIIVFIVLFAFPAHSATITGWVADTPDTLLRPTADAPRLHRVGQFATGPGWINLGEGTASLTIPSSAHNQIVTLILLDASDVRRLPPSQIRWGDEDWIDVPRAPSGSLWTATREVSGGVDALILSIRGQAAHGMNNGQTACVFTVAKAMKKIAKETK